MPASMAAGQGSELSAAQDAEGDKPPSGSDFQWDGADMHGDHDDGSVTDDDDLAPDQTGGSRPTAQMQKRRRVTRACDECRRKKIKCDGKQPCTHCTVYSYDCSYDQPSNRRRNPAPQYIEAIENRLHRAESLLKSVMPNVDLDDPGVNTSGPPPVHFPQPGYERNAGQQARDKAQKQAAAEGADGEKDSMLESMVQNTGSLDIDDRGYWDFSGHSSGLVFLKRLKEQFGDVMGEAEGHGQVFMKARHFSHVLDSPTSYDSPSDSGLPNIADLPSKECALHLCDVALNDAFAIMRFIHLPTFNIMINRIYDIPADQWTNDENRYLPLVYAVLAVGSMFARKEDSKLQLLGYDAAIQSGFKYFKASRHMMDITDCRDLPSLQAVVCMILFLQSSAKLSVCYSYIGVALTSSIRMGLHRAIKGQFDPIEAEIRKRIFWQVRRMDIYVGAMLGLPMMLSDEDIDQPLPKEVDDEYITLDGIKPMPDDYTPVMSAVVAHTRLIKILRDVVKNIYPLKGMHIDGHPQSYTVSHAKIREIERRLANWMDDLPMGLRPGGVASPELERAQQLLRISYAHVQLFTYRPFLHYASKKSDRHVDKRSYACAAACISVSRNIIHLTVEMSRRGLLVGAYWFTMYTNFMAILALVFFVLENPQNTSSRDILKDAQQGRELLASLASRSMAADRCSTTLEGLFKYLETFKTHRGINARKRHGSPEPRAVAAQNAQKAQNPSGSTREHQAAAQAPTHAVPRRASTFPNNPPAASLKRASHTFSQETMAAAGRDVYSPPNEPSSTGGMTPESTSSNNTTAFNNTPMSQTLGTPQSASAQVSGLPDFSAMMFPSGDPFAYPNQPMTTLEDTHYGPNSKGNAGSANGDVSIAGDAKAAGQPGGGLFPTSPTAQVFGQPLADGSVDMQIFGLPPFLMQGQQPNMNMGLGLFEADSAVVNGDMWGGPFGTGEPDWSAWGEGNFGGAQ